MRASFPFERQTFACVPPFAPALPLELCASASVAACVYLALDDVIILVDLQVVPGVARDGAAVSVVEVASGATAFELCIAD